MKRLMIIAATALLTLSLTACERKQETTTTTTTESTQPAATVTEPESQTVEHATTDAEAAGATSQE